MILEYRMTNPSQIGYLEPEDQLDIIERETRRGLLNQIYDQYISKVKVEKLKGDDGKPYYSAMCDCVAIPLTHTCPEPEEE